MDDTSDVLMSAALKGAGVCNPMPDAIARGWLSDLFKTCREEIRLTKRRITSYEVWERALAKVMDTEMITDDGDPVELSGEAEQQTRSVALKMAEAAAQATGVGLAVRE